MTEISPAEPQRGATGGARVSGRIGKAIAFDASIGPTGLLAVAALVSASLLGSAAIVLAARRRDGHRATPRLESAAPGDRPLLTTR